MDRMARDLEGKAHFLFVYTREAHPDDYPDYPSHKSFEQKVSQARAMAECHDTPRRILVDGLEGEVHHQYGVKPNMTYIIDHTGRVAFKSDWTVAGDIRASLERLITTPEAKRVTDETGDFFMPYYKEEASYIIMPP